jgi:hypothetical protein
MLQWASVVVAVIMKNYVPAVKDTSCGILSSGRL